MSMRRNYGYPAPFTKHGQPRWVCIYETKLFVPSPAPMPIRHNYDYAVESSKGNITYASVTILAQEFFVASSMPILTQEFFVPSSMLAAMRTLAAATILCWMARLFYCTRFRKRITTMGAGLASLYLLWPVWLMLHEIGTTWRICGYQCCTGKLQS